MAFESGHNTNLLIAFGSGEAVGQTEFRLIPKFASPEREARRLEKRGQSEGVQSLGIVRFISSTYEHSAYAREYSHLKKDKSDIRSSTIAQKEDEKDCSDFWSIVIRPGSELFKNIRLLQGSSSAVGKETLIVETWRWRATSSMKSDCMITIRITSSIPPRGSITASARKSSLCAVMRMSEHLLNF